MRLQQWSPNRTRNGITSEQKTTWYQGRTSKIIQTKSKFIRPNRNQLYSYVGPYRSLQYEQLEVSCTCRNNVGTSIIFITSTIPKLTGRSSAGAIFDKHNTIAPRAHYLPFHSGEAWGDHETWFGPLPPWPCTSRGDLWHDQTSLVCVWWKRHLHTGQALWMCDQHWEQPAYCSPEDLIWQAGDHHNA